VTFPEKKLQCWCWYDATSTLPVVFFFSTFITRFCCILFLFCTFLVLSLLLTYFKMLFCEQTLLLPMMWSDWVHDHFLWKEIHTVLSSLIKSTHFEKAMIVGCESKNFSCMKKQLLDVCSSPYIFNIFRADVMITDKATCIN